MPKLMEELVHIEDLPFTLDDVRNTFEGSCPSWSYVWYRIENNNQEVLLVAYSTREELLQREKDR